MQKKIMSSFVGNKIYSNFRANNLLRVIQAKHPSVVDLSSAYIHIFESEEKLNSIELNNLKQILDYGEKADIQKNSITNYLLGLGLEQFHHGAHEPKIL